MKISISVKMQINNLLGSYASPPGAEALGTVTRNETDVGALIRLSTGIYVQGNAGAIRAFHSATWRPDWPPEHSAAGARASRKSRLRNKHWRLAKMERRGTAKADQGRLTTPKLFFHFFHFLVDYRKALC